MTAIRRGWFHLASGALLGRVLGFASNLLLSRWLGPTELGLFNLISTTVQTSDVVVRCGGDYALNFELGGQPEAIKTEPGALLARALVQICSLATIFTCVSVGIWIWSGQGLLPIALPASHRLFITACLLLMIACEGSSASAWEILLVSHRTAPFALKQGLYYPLRLLFSAFGALLAGSTGAIGGWTVVALAQCFWLKSLLGSLWKPLHIIPILGSGVRQLIKRGFGFYAANLLVSIIFYPLLLKVAAGSGLAEIGYLRVGQLLQQLFAFLPATLVPVLFLKLRGESSFPDQVALMERPLRIIWLLLLEVLLLYSTFDEFLISWLFGGVFVSALLPTRLLLITALFECLAQLVVQPLLAAGQTRLYSFWQNSAALIAAVLGWYWIPSAGLAAYLSVRLLYVIVPLVGFGMPVVRRLQHPQKLLSLTIVSIALLGVFLAQSFNHAPPPLMPFIYITVFIAVLALYRKDILSARQLFSTAG